MNKRIKELEKQCWSHRVDGALVDGHLHFDRQKFAELIVRECAKLNRTKSYELSGVVVDTEDGHGFDDVCLTTVKRVEQYLAGDDLLKHFGVEE